MAGSHKSYAQLDGSWQEVTPDEIKKIALFGPICLYFGLIRVGQSVEWYWSTATLLHGLWARTFMTRNRLKALMAMLHVVDPGSEVEGDKLRKINPLIDFFKNRYQEFYQPRQNVAVDEQMVKSRHRSGIRQFKSGCP